MTALIFFGTTLILAMLLSVAMVHWGAKIVKSERRSIYRATAAVALNFVIGILVLVGARRLGAVSPAYVVWVLEVLSIGVIWWVYVSLFRLKPGRGLLLWLMSIVPNIAVAVASAVIIQPYLFEAFVTPSNSMAPTLLGWHKTTTCPKCGGRLIVGQPRPNDPDPFYPDKPLGICMTCRQTSSVDNPRTPLNKRDGIIVDKTAEPRRWDLVVFRVPGNPSVLYVMRLVGLPEEDVRIADGVVRINGVPLEPPAEIEGVRYAGADDSEFQSPGEPLDVKERWQLQPDEFVVLGDFSKRSKDSRFWGPVPRANLVGVVTVRYWPPSRWKVFR